MFAYHNPSARLIASLTEYVKRAQTVFSHPKRKTKYSATTKSKNNSVPGSREQYHYTVKDGVAHFTTIPCEP